MNGLKYIRTRCNLSLNELADAIGVTRQALSSWEVGKKPIPSQRLEQLSNFFGIDNDYFGNITEDKKKYLLEKAMFRYVENGKETYRYKPQNESSLKDSYVCFLGDDSVSLDEKYVAAQKKKQAILDKADEIIRYYDKGGSIHSQLININRGCTIYGGINDLMDEMPQKAVIHRMAYFHEINNVISALLLAYGLKSKEDIIQENLPYKDSPLYDGTDWIFSLSEQLQKRWQGISDELTNIDANFKAQRKTQLESEKLTPPAIPTVAEQIQDFEDKNREFWEEHPEMKNKSGLSFFS